MLCTENFGDVTRLVLSTRVSRAVGYSVSVYLVRGMAVDLGFPAVEQDIAAMLAQVRPAGVLLTHYHEDHGGNAELAAREGLPLALSDATLAHLRAATPLALYRRLIWGTPPRLVSPITRFGSDALRLVPTPGHSDDHHVVWDAERETLFSGDLFLGVKVRLAHPSENPHQLARSVRAAAALRPARMFDAHRGPIAHPVEALSAKANWKATPVICAPAESNAAAMIVAVSPTLSVVGKGARSTCATLRRPVHGKPRPQGAVTSVPLLEQAATSAIAAVRRKSRVRSARTRTILRWMSAERAAAPRAESQGQRCSAGEQCAIVPSC